MSKPRPLSIRSRNVIGFTLILLGMLVLAGCTGSAPVPDPKQVALGQTIYQANCASCHGPRGEGQPDWKRQNADDTYPPPPHDSTGHTWHHPDAVLFRITLLGGQAVAPPGFASGMPAFGDKLDEREIRAVLAFIKSTWPEDIRARQEAIDRRAAGR